MKPAEIEVRVRLKRPSEAGLAYMRVLCLLEDDRQFPRGADWPSDIVPLFEADLIMWDAATCMRITALGLALLAAIDGESR